MPTRQRKPTSLLVIIIVLGSVSNALAGSIVSWGRTDNGLVSDTPTGSDFVAIAGGGWRSHALKEDGSIVSWGGDQYGLVSTTPTGSDFIDIAAGSNYQSIALKQDGSIVSWGCDEYGNIIGLISNTPTGSGFVDITGGSIFSLALKNDGSIIAWGGPNYYGEVSQIPAGNNFVDIAAGQGHGLALKNDGSIVAWGRNNDDQVSNTPTGGDFVDIAAGTSHNLALKADGSIVSWGRDDELGLVSSTPTGNDFVAIAAGGYHSLALKADGSIVAWGYNNEGQVSNTPTGNNFVTIAGGIFHSLALEAINDPPVPNVAPTVGPIAAPVDPVQLGSGDVCAMAEFVDLDEADTHTAEWDWDDGVIDPGTVDEALGYGSVDDCHAYTEAGIYTITLTVTDDEGDSGESEFQYVVVYDPSGGFVTGGGWIDSPSGAYTPSDPDDDDLTGKANFGFVSKYKKGATTPTGQTEFVFQAGDLNFHSNSYEWLVVNQAGTNAQFKGSSGTINGAGDYKFMLWAGDDTPDTFRIKIWYEDGAEVVIYDNGFDKPIGGGSIVIHTK